MTKAYTSIRQGLIELDSYKKLVRSRIYFNRIPEKYHLIKKFFKTGEISFQNFVKNQRLQSLDASSIITSYSKGIGRLLFEEFMKGYRYEYRIEYLYLENLLVCFGRIIFQVRYLRNNSRTIFYHLHIKLINFETKDSLKLKGGIKLPLYQLNTIIKNLKRHPHFEQRPTTNQYEVLRGILHGSLIILFSSGSITYQENPKIERYLNQMNIKTNSSSENPKYVVYDRSYIQLTQDQFSRLLELIEENNKPVPNEGEERIFFDINGIETIFDSEKLTVYSKFGYSHVNYILTQAISEFPIFGSYDYIIGQDEVGTGELYGPVVVGSVVLTEVNSIYLQSQGVKDSKELTKDQISNLEEVIRSNSVSIQSTEINAERLDQLMIQFDRENKSFYDLLAWAHSNAFENILKTLKNLQGKKILLVIDKFHREKLDLRIEKLLKTNIDIIQTSKAENLYTAVAAASIIAKSKRNKYVKAVSSQLGFSPNPQVNYVRILMHPSNKSLLRNFIISNMIERGSLIETEIIFDEIAQNYLNLILRKNGRNRIFKQLLPKNKVKIAGFISNLANTKGGDIYFGITKLGDLIGTDPNLCYVKIHSALKLLTPKPKLKITVFSNSGLNIVRVHIPTTLVKIKLLKNPRK